MSNKTANRLNSIQPSATLTIDAKAKVMISNGVDLISFVAGEPDFDTPIHIKEAAIKAIKEGQTKYTATGGSPKLKKAIIEKFKRENNLNFNESEVTSGNGGKHILYNIFMAALNPGDEVIIPAPYWVSYPDQVKLAEAKPVIVDCDVSNNYLLTPEKLESAITKSTRMFIINSPSNPTGGAYTKEELQKIGEVLQKHPEILIVSDDIYEHIIFDNLKFYNLLMLFPKFKERIFIVNGVSKAYSMTGWRSGYCGAPSEYIKAMEKLQGQCTSNPSSISQAATIEALVGDQTCVKEMCEAFQKRRDLMYKSLSAMNGIKCQNQLGAFYAFPDVSSLYKKEKFQKIVNDFKKENPNENAKENSKESLSQIFCTILLEKYKIATVPGIAFGNDFAIRLSYAMSEDKINKGLDRLDKMIEDLQ